MTYVLRPRQVKFKEDIKNAFRSSEKGGGGFKKVLAVAPCGFGKTPTLVTIIGDAVEKNSKVLFLAHRKELIDQCSVDLLNSKINHGVIASQHPRVNLMANVQVASWQTLKNKKREIFIPNLIIYDEAHRAAAPQPMEVLSRYSNDALLLGFTGTPYRTDGKGLKEVFETIVPSCQSSDLIKENLLLNPRYFRCGTTKNVTKILTQDLNEEDAKEVEADIVLNADIVRNFKNICPKAQAVVFCPTVERAEEIAKKFEKSGFKSAVVDALTPKNERTKILNDFAQKKFQIILNASLLSEGWNYPALDCVILLRNLNSRVFYRQAVNRCMRIHDNKKECYVLDFFDCYEKFGYPDEDEDYFLDEDVKRKENSEEKNNVGKRTICINCSCAVLISEEVCPNCNTPITKEEKIIVEAVNDLEEINKDTHPVTKADKQLEYNRLCAICMQKNYSPGWVGIQFKNKFGIWPKALVRTNGFINYSNNFKKEKMSNTGELRGLFDKIEFGY